jgi:hypothetical protein
VRVRVGSLELTSFKRVRIVSLKFGASVQLDRDSLEPTDLFGPTQVQGLGGYRYYIVMYDNYSRRYHIEVLKHKTGGDVSKAMVDYINEAETRDFKWLGCLVVASRCIQSMSFSHDTRTALECMLILASSAFPILVVA